MIRMNGWGWFALVCALGAVATAIGALGFWAAGDPPDTGRTLSVIAGLVCAAMLSTNLMRK